MRAAGPRPLSGVGIRRKHPALRQENQRQADGDGSQRGRPGGAVQPVHPNVHHRQSQGQLPQMRGGHPQQRAAAAGPGKNGMVIVAEEFIDFERELSVIAVRSSCQAVVYPVSETTQREGRLFPSSDRACRPVAPRAFSV